MIEGTTTTEYALLEDSIVKEVMENETPIDKFKQAILRIRSPYLLPRFLSNFSLMYLPTLGPTRGYLKMSDYCISNTYFFRMIAFNLANSMLQYAH
jgi:hypothetical protein